MGGYFDRYRLFKYLMENILTDGHCLSPYTCKRCIVFQQLDGLNFDNLAGKHQKRQNPPLPINILRYMANITKDCSQFLVMPIRQTTSDVMVLKIFLILYFYQQSTTLKDFQIGMKFIYVIVSNHLSSCNL